MTAFIVILDPSFDVLVRLSAYHAKPTPQESFSRLGSYNPLARCISHNWLGKIRFKANSLFHRQGTRPRCIILESVLILIVRLVLSFDLDVSVIEVVDSAHIRQEGRRIRGRYMYRSQLSKALNFVSSSSVLRNMSNHVSIKAALVSRHREIKLRD